MSEPIKPGDLVVAIRWNPCCCGLGIVRQVASIEHRLADGCTVCRTPSSGVRGACAVWPTGGHAPLSWLKRIPPLPELEYDSLTDGDLAEQRRIHDAWAKV
jgi:hypothetical protein